jgi:hypothetical protein
LFGAAQVEITIQPGDVLGWHRLADLQSALDLEQFAASSSPTSSNITFDFGFS